MAQAAKRTTTPPPNPALLAGIVNLPTVPTDELLAVLDLAWNFAQVATAACNAPRSRESELISEVADAADKLIDDVATELATRSSEDGHQRELMARARLRYLSRVGEFADIATAAVHYAAAPVLA